MNQVKLPWIIKEKVGTGMMNPHGIDVPAGYYKHFKGNIYRVLGKAIHSETQESMVVYQAEYGEKQLFVRPTAMFIDTLERDGVTHKRFQLMTPEEIGDATGRIVKTK